MTSLTVIENKISDVEKYLRILGSFQKYSRQEIEQNILIRGAVERYLYLAVQATINVAEALVAHKNLRKPSTLSEAFHILGEEKLVTKSVVEHMIKMTGFRNIIVHDYTAIDYDIVYEILHDRLEDIHTFIFEVRKVLGR